MGMLFVLLVHVGFGKSTLLRCINMLETPTVGEILHNKENIMKKLKEITALCGTCRKLEWFFNSLIFLII